MDLIGKSFTFGVYVEKDNVQYGGEIFRVGKVYKDRMNFLTGSVTPSHSDKTLTITSGDKVHMLLKVVLFTLRFF